MLQKFPFDVGNIWEVDLEAFMVSTWATFTWKDQDEFPSATAQIGYYADVLRGVITCKEAVDETVETLNGLFAAGATGGVKSFVEYGKSAVLSTRVVWTIDKFITSYVNELFKYVCESTTHIDSFFEDYNDLVIHSSSNANMKFVVTLVDQFVTEFININKDEPTRLDTGLMAGDEDKLAVVYRVRAAFTKATYTLFKSLLNSGITPEIDKSGVTLTVKAGTKLHNSFAAQVKDCFNNRVLRLYIENPESTQGVTRFTVFKCLNDNYKIRLL